MKKILIFFFCIFSFSAVAMEKSTTFNKDIFTKAQSEGKIVVVSSWIKYCNSCASQMKAINQLRDESKNFEYYTFDVTNEEIADFFNVTIGQICGIESLPANIHNKDDLLQRSTGILRIPILSWEQAITAQTMLQSITPFNWGDWTESSLPVSHNTYALKILHTKYTMKLLIKFYLR